jgi:hypothetical protein
MEQHAMVRVADGADVPAARQPVRPSSTVSDTADPSEAAVDIPPDPFTAAAVPQDRSATRRLTSVRSAASQARRFLTAVLGEAGMPTSTVSDAHTVVSEFVVEALARGRPPRQIRVDINADELFVELLAEGRCDPIDADDSRHMSTDLVAMISPASGSRPISDGRIWWARLPIRQADENAQEVRRGPARSTRRARS